MTDENDSTKNARTYKYLSQSDIENHQSNDGTQKPAEPETEPEPDTVESPQGSVSVSGSIKMDQQSDPEPAKASSGGESSSILSKLKFW